MKNTFLLREEENKGDSLLDVPLMSMRES